MRCLQTLAMAIVVMIANLATSAVAESPAGMKLYAFSSGALTIGKGVLQNFGPMEPPIKIPVGFFVIKHPKGNVLYDTGIDAGLIVDELRGKFLCISRHLLEPVLFGLNQRVAEARQRIGWHGCVVGMPATFVGAHDIQPLSKVACEARARRTGHCGDGVSAKHDEPGTG